MNSFKNTLSYKFGVIGGYVYILTILAVMIYSRLIDLGLLKITGYWGILEHPETMLAAFIVFCLIFISFIIIPNIGLGLFLKETMHEKIGKYKAGNPVVEIINFISFIVYAWLSVMLLLAGAFAPPCFPLIILLIYFIVRITKAKKNV